MRQPNFIVDGHMFHNEDSDLAADGEFPPFRVFDIEAQEYAQGDYDTRAAAQAVADALNREQMTPHAIIDDSDPTYYRDNPDAPEIAWAYPAKREDAEDIMSRPTDTMDGRSKWVWLRLRDGTLILGVFPQGDTYMEFSDAGVAPFGPL